MDKHPPQGMLKESPWSASLRRIGHHINRGRIQMALQETDGLLGQSDLTGHQKSRVMALVADSEFKRGRYEQAARIQLKAAATSVDHATLWLRPHVGHVRALLKIPRVDQAVVMARQVVSISETKRARFDEQVRRANRLAERRQQVVVSELPPRVSVVATRMGYLFLQEGEPEAAEEFFQKAIQSAKGGANRARQGLASIAQARGEHAAVAEITAEAIRKGHCRAKTLSAWGALISARRKMGCWRISDRLIKGLDSVPASLRARAITVIVTELRKNGMRQWRTIGEAWLEKEGAAFPLYEKAIRKLLSASARMEVGHAADSRMAAEQLLQMRFLGRRDWLAAAKEHARAELLEGCAVDLDRLLSDARARYGEEYVPVAAHGLALTCLSLNRSDLARPLLQTIVRDSRPGRTRWGKAIWALARMEQKGENHLEAAKLYQQLFEADKTPERYRLQAQLKWAQEVILSGNAEAFWEAHARMSETLNRVEDPEILMNFARQLLFGPSELRPWGKELYLRGETLALSRFAAATHPSVAMGILFRLTRRQVVDFDRGAAAIELWEGFDAQKKDWLWSGSSTFWEYIGCLYTAYLRKEGAAAAETFAKEFLDDPATPVAGQPYIGIPYARHLIDAGRVDEGLALFERMASVAPRHPLCAWAWYWLALKAWREAALDRAKEHARNIRAAQGAQPGILNGLRLDARALLILADLEPGRVDTASTSHSRAFLDEQNAIIFADLQKVPV